MLHFLPQRRETQKKEDPLPSYPASLFAEERDKGLTSGCETKNVERVPFLCQPMIFFFEGNRDCLQNHHASAPRCHQHASRAHVLLQKNRLARLLKLKGHCIKVRRWRLGSIAVGTRSKAKTRTITIFRDFGIALRRLR